MYVEFGDVVEVGSYNTLIFGRVLSHGTQGLCGQVTFSSRQEKETHGISS